MAPPLFIWVAGFLAGAWDGRSGAFSRQARHPPALLFAYLGPLSPPANRAGG